MGARVNCAIQTNIHQGVPSALIPATDNYPSRSNCSSCAALTAGCIEQHGANSAAARLSHSSSIGTPRFARFAVRASHPTRVLHKYTDDAATAAPILCTLYVPNRSCATPRPVRLPRSIYLCGSTIAFSTSIAMRLLGHGAPASRASCTPRTRLGRTLTRKANCACAEYFRIGKLCFSAIITREIGLRIWQVQFHVQRPKPIRPARVNRSRLPMQHTRREASQHDLRAPPLYSSATLKSRW